MVRTESWRGFLPVRWPHTWVIRTNKQEGTLPRHALGIRQIDHQVRVFFAKGVCLVEQSLLRISQQGVNGVRDPGCGY